MVKRISHLMRSELAHGRGSAELAGNLALHVRPLVGVTEITGTAATLNGHIAHRERAVRS